MPTVGLNLFIRRSLSIKKQTRPRSPKIIRPKTTEMTTPGSTPFFAVEAAEVPSGSEVVETATVGSLLDDVNRVVATIVVGSTVVIIVVTVVGTVVVTVLVVVVVATSMLVTMVVSVTDTITVVVNADGFKFPLGAESAFGTLGADVSFAVPMALGMGRPLSSPLTLGVGRSFSIPRPLGVGTSFPIAESMGEGASFPTGGTLGADWSFPSPLSFSFSDDRTDPKESMIDLEKRIISSSF